jgi:hypothetical protein
MAGDSNRPYSWTELARRKFQAYCSDYAAILLQVWAEMNGQFAARRLDVALHPTSNDGHTLVELLNPDTQGWMLLDPTFDLTAKHTADGAYATAEDVSAATHNQEWADISYVFLGPLKDHYGKTYILDYPLLFNNVYHSGEKWTHGVGAPVLPYMSELVMPVSGLRQAVAIGCGMEKTAVLSIDGVEQTIDCSGVDGLSHTFYATTILPMTQTSASVKAYRPQRHVF